MTEGSLQPPAQYYSRRQLFLRAPPSFGRSFVDQIETLEFWHSYSADMQKHDAVKKSEIRATIEKDICISDRIPS